MRLDVREQRFFPVKIHGRQAVLDIRTMSVSFTVNSTAAMSLAEELESGKTIVVTWHELHCLGFLKS